jgi:hypothetical protein
LTRLIAAPEPCAKAIRPRLAEAARVREKIKPVVDKYAKDVGEPMMKELNAEIAKARGV